MADRYSFGHKALSVVLSVVLLGFGWPAVNPSETFASDESAQADQVQAEVAQPEETQALEETADDSAAMALAAADEAAPVAASDERAVAEPAADESAMASAPSASGEEEASAVEDAVEEDSAVDNQGLSQAAAAQAKTEYDISLVLKNASIKKADGTDELVSLPATKVTVSADNDFKFTVVPDSACKLNRVLVNVAGQESPLTPDADGVYVVASSDIAKGATLTVEASSSLGNVGTVLGGVLGGGAAAASDVSGNAGETTSAKVGDKVTLKGTSNKNCSYVGEWTVKKNGESTSAATIKGNGGSATAVFSEAGTFEIGHAYCEASHFLGFPGHSVKTETFTVVVQPATPARSISIFGSDTVTQFSNIRLTATVDPAEATGTYEWSSSNEDILTVDNSGNVTGVRQGTATVTVSFISAVGGSEVSVSKDVTVTATKDATDQALVYYLLDPTKDANSNDSGHWGKTSLGIATVNTTGATWAGGKNCFDNVDQRVVSWPKGTNVVPRDSGVWNEIFDNYKTTIQAQLPGVTFTKDDVEEIALVPAKISKNNGTNPDMHLDCNVSIKCKNVALVKYYLRDAGSTQFEQKGARNYISGNATQPSDVMNEQFPETKTVDGVTYTFSGWYLDRSFTQPATFPYTVNSSTSFYAKYVGGFQVTYNLAGGSWGNSDATTYIAQEGSTQTVKSAPTREGYKFTGWTIEGLPDTTALKSGETFAMPAGNVTITANWQEKDPVEYTVNYYLNGTEQKVAKSDTKSAPWDTQVKASDLAKGIDGYTAVSNQDVTITVNRDGKSSINVYYYQNVSLKANSAEVTYNGKDQSVSGFTGTPEGADFSNITVGAHGTDAGTYDAQFAEGTVDTIDKTEKYIVASVENGSLVINKAKATIAPKDATKAYDGTDLKASEFVTEGFVKDQGVKSATFTGSQLNVGKSKSGIDGYVLADGTNANNYDITKGTGNLEVTPVSDEVTVTITGNAATLKYDGTEQSVTGYTVACSNGLYTANDFDFTGAAVAKGTNVGTYKMGLDKGQFSNTSANFSNVTFVVVDGQLTITPKSVDPEAGKGMSVGKLPHITYNGKSQKQKPEVKDGNTLLTEGTDYTLSYSEDTTNVGTVTVTVEGKGNYAGEAEVTYEILKRQVTLESASASKVYDGTPLTKPEVTVGGDGFVEGEVSGLKAIGTVTNVADGEVDNEIVWDWAEGFGEGNYDITKTEGKLSIEPQSIDPSNPESYTGIKVGELSDLLYKGKDQFQEPTVTDAKGNLLVKDRDYTLAFDGDAKNVTEAGVSVTVSGIGNYKGDFSRSYKILPREVTVKSASASKAYDGTPLFSHDVVVTSAAGFVEDDVASMTAPNSITEVGSLTNEIAIEWSNDVAAGNYVVSKEEGVLEVTPKSVTAEGFSVEGLNDVTYNGLAQQQEPTVKDGDKTLTKDKDYTLSFTEDVTNVGTVRVAVTGKGNYTGSADVAYQILPAKLIVTTPSDSMVYNGKPLTAEGSIEGFVNNETAVFETTGSQTEVGESENAYAIYWSDEGTTAKRSNYTVEEHIGTLTVTEYADEIVAVANDVTMTYDGTPHRAEVTVTGVPEGYSVKTAWSGAEATDVTGADGLVANVDEIVVVNAEGKDVTDSLKITKKPGKLVIEPKELTVVTMGASKPYDGTPLTANGKIEGFVNGETAAFAVIGSQTEVGECTNAYTIEWSGNAKQGNYTVKEELGKLEVTKSQAAIVIVPKGGKKTYDGTPLVSEGADAYGLPAGFTCEATTKGSVTNVGSAVAEIDTYAIKNADGKDVTDQFGNVSTGFATLLVTRRPVTVVSEDASKVYDGTPLTKHEAGVTEGSMVDGENFVYEFTGIQTVAGESPNSFIISAGDGTNLDNYEITKQEGTLKVEPKGIVPGEDNGMKVTKPVDKVYNGKEQKFVPVVTDGDKALVENVDYVVTYTDALDFEDDAAAKDDFTNVTGDIFVTVTGIGNYAGSLTQSYQITPKPYTVTTVSGSKVYDGTPLEGASLEGNFVGGLVNNDDATFVVTGTQTEVGASDNTYTLEFVDERMAKNYKLVKEDIGTLTVVKDESEASQNSNGNGESKNKGALPKTGDMTLATLPFVLAVVAGAVLCAAPVARRRSKF